MHAVKINIVVLIFLIVILGTEYKKGANNVQAAHIIALKNSAFDPLWKNKEYKKNERAC